MHLEHSFSVPVGIDEAWKTLLDIERIAPCMPGAALDSVDGDDFTGTVKVKLGPINLTYKGKASFVEKDEAARRAVIDARGRDARGNGTAAAKVTATLVEADGSTNVAVSTDLDITGKPAQFGRGVMVDVGNKLIGQFADSLAATLQSGGERSAAAAAKQTPPRAAGGPSGGSEAKAPDEPPAAAPHDDPASAEALAEAPADAPPAAVSAVNGHPASATAHEPPPEVEPINLLEHAGPAIAKRLAPVAAGLVIVLVVLRWLRARQA